MIRYFRNMDTGTVHLVADIPAPAHRDRVQCGQFWTSALLPLNEQQVKCRVNPEDICRRCKQLTGVE